MGIGASAGGLEAIESFFDNLPKQTGLAFVIIQHLSPDFRSMMDELLARHTELPIKLVENGIPVEADHVYLIPPKNEMIISEGRLLLSEQDRHQERTLPIDIFFRSLAQDCGPRGVAVILSGGGSDGSRGIRDVNEAGGLVIVQDVDTAQFDGMPRAAAESGLAHWVAPPSDMPRILLEHAAGRANAPQVERSPEPQVGNRSVVEVYRMLQEEYGIDFTHYKPSTVTRRIERRLALARSTDIDEYVRRLKSERSELDVLYRDLLIEVTRFFRDDQAFQILEEKVLPDLLARQPREAPLRLWVAGCATGEEAYSLAILLEDLMAKLGERPVKIFATDVHRGSLEHATRAIYTEEALAGVSEERLSRYFTRIGERYQVVPELRQRIVFAQHNVIKDAPFTRVDLVTCRNLLIYLQPAAQQKVLSLFHFALTRNGFLFLGPSETVGPLAVGYETVDKHWRLYRKRNDARIPVDARLQPVTTRTALPPFQPAGGRYSLSQLLGTYDALLERTMPPSLLVNERAELVHAFGGAGAFLHHRDGRQALDVLELVDAELKMVLVGGLKRAIIEPAAIVYRNVRISGHDGERTYKVTIQRIGSRGGGAPHLLVSFEPMQATGATEVPPGTEIEMDQVSRDRLRVLEAELAHTKESLQSAIEELETSNEELQASNEELQTSNEELQSTNEELQSVNEELYTVNAEYQRKIGELTEVTNDMDNLLASTEIGTIFLDAELKIRKFTPQIAKAFSLVPHDVGRSIETFVHRMEHPELVEDLTRVLTTGQPVERELDDVDGKAFYSRILPYRTKGAIAGVVITLIDVSGLKTAEDALFHERYLLNNLLASIPDAIYFKDLRGRLIRANEAMAARLGLRDPAAAVGKTALELPNQEMALELHRKDEVVIRTGETHHYKLERSLAAKPGEPDCWDLVTRLPLRDRAGALVGMAAIFRDVTEQKLAEEKIQDNIRRRDQFLAMLSHELRNPLGAIVNATALLKSPRAAANTPKFLTILERQSEQMADLLDDLLEASRVTQNKITLKRRVIDLRSAAREAADSTRGLIESRGLTFTADLDGEPLWIDADPARLQQIQANLLSNAAKYTPKGGHVSLRVGCEAGAAVFRLKDDGVGLLPEMAESIFDLFVQSKRTLDRSGGGLGVGLTLVRSLVTLHGGTVQVYSEGEGKGCEFVVRLPLTDRRETKEDAPSQAIESVSGPLREGAKVVIVEDRADSRELLCELLSEEGFSCRTAESGPEGLALIDEFRPDVAILDLGLPGMDGFEVARRLRANPKHAGMLLIALTGYGQPSERTRGKEAGFDQHLVKPVTVDELTQLLTGLRGGRPEAVAPAKSSRGDEEAAVDDESELAG
ncbi:MAG TPA: chemotaxis protein CheB [Polyangia bacterium]|nr:chemotaxis protein CheB [Polyangia bacterium]